jgi:O-antigen/teichoic acid export membrane protein
MLAKLTSPYVVGVIARMLGQVISFLGVAIASRFLDLQAFGTYALAWAATVIATTFVFTGFYQALLRSREYGRDRDSLFWLKLGVGSAGSLVIFVLGQAAGGLSSPTGFALCALAPIPALQSASAWWEAQLVRAKRVRAASLYVVAAEALGLVTTFMMLRVGWGIEALIAARYTVTIVGLVLTGSLVRALPRLTIRRDATRSAAATALPLWGTSSIGLFSNYGADLILGAFLNPAAVGAYRGGARIAMTASDLVLHPLVLLAWSKFTRLEKDGEPTDALRRAWLDSMAIAAAILWPIAASVALLAPMLVTAILDATWLPAASIVSILSVSRALSFLSALLEPTMMCSGNPGKQLRVRAVGAVSLLILLLTFGRYGPEAAAFAHVATSVTVASLSLTAMARVLSIRVSELVSAFLPGLVLALLSVLAILSTETPRSMLGGNLGLVATIGLVGAVWGLLMAVFLNRRVLVLPTP